MTAPPYALLAAADRGRWAADAYVAARKKWPLAKIPENPFPLTDPGDKRHEFWEKSFRETLKRWEGL